MTLSFIAVASLLKPGFLLDLIKRLSLTSDDYIPQNFDHNIPQLKGLPIFLSPWPMAQILNGHKNFTLQQQESIMKWAEQYDLFYSLGYYGMYFIPLLSTEFLGDDASYDWPEEKELWNNRTETAVLYAKLNFSTTDHFFYLVLTEILKEILKGIVRNTPLNPVQKCYINYGCTEAIMPIYISEVGSEITVYLRSHLLQNVIEFRTK